MTLTSQQNGSVEAVLAAVRRISKEQRRLAGITQNLAQKAERAANETALFALNDDEWVNGICRVLLNLGEQQEALREELEKQIEILCNLWEKKA